MDRKQAMAKLAEHNSVTINKADVQRIMQKIHDTDVEFGEELHLTDDYIPELSEIFLRQLENPKELERIVGNFLFEGGDIIGQVQMLHKVIGIYDRNEWLEENDKYCAKCGEHYCHEDLETATLEKCKKCGNKLEINTA
jgi:hypothetical protein